MKNLILTLIITLPLTLWGQGWEQTFGGNDVDRGRSVLQTNDGGYILTGFTKSSGNGLSDVYLIKTDNSGYEQWSKTYGGSSSDDGSSVQQTTDGGYIISGSTGINGNGDYDIWLIKTDENGNEIWSQTYGGNSGDESYSVIETIDSEFVIVGFTTSFGNGNEDIWLIKTNQNGIEQWSQTYGGVEEDIGVSIQQTNDGGFIITGYTNSFGNGNRDVYLIKTDGNGNELWSQTFGGIFNDLGHSVQQTTDGGFIITGVTTSFVDPLGDIYLIKTDNNGNEQWIQTYGGVEYDLSYSVKQTNDNGYIILGETESFGSGKLDFYLVKTDENGNYEWSQTYGGVEDDWGISLDITSDGGFILCGVTESFGNNIQEDILLIKTDDQGNITSTFEIPLPNPNRKLEKTVNLKGQEIKPQTNTPIIEIFDDGTVEKKIVVE